MLRDLPRPCLCSDRGTSRNSALLSQLWLLTITSFHLGKTRNIGIEIGCALFVHLDFRKVLIDGGIIGDRRGSAQAIRAGIRICVGIDRRFTDREHDEAAKCTRGEPNYLNAQLNKPRFLKTMHNNSLSCLFLATVGSGP
jgi:hypothetical protein